MEIVDELSSFLVHIAFSEYGGPLLNPEIHDIVAYGHKRKICVEMCSNLLLPDDLAWQKPIEGWLDLMVVAIDVAPQGQNWRPICTMEDDIDEVKDRLSRLVELAEGFDRCLRAKIGHGRLLHSGILIYSNDAVASCC